MSVRMQGVSSCSQVTHLPRGLKSAFEALLSSRQGTYKYM